MSDPTLLEQLDAAEARLVHAESELARTRAMARTMINAGATPRDAARVSWPAEVDVMAAAAHAHITAARCAVAIEEVPYAD